MRFEVLPHTGARGPGRGLARLGGRLIVVAVAACSGPARTQIAIGPPPAKETHAVLAGGLCQDNHCTCHREPGDGGVGVPETKDRKRFEFRLTSAYDLWLTINHQ